MRVSVHRKLKPLVNLRNILSRYLSMMNVDAGLHQMVVLPKKAWIQIEGRPKAPLPKQATNPFILYRSIVKREREAFLLSARPQHAIFAQLEHGALTFPSAHS